jgi:hypothetical protein
MMTLGVGVEEKRKDRAEEKKQEGLFRRPGELEKETLDALGLEGGWRCLMDRGRLDTGVAKGSLSLGELWSCRLCLDEEHACLEEEECCRRRARATLRFISVAGYCRQGTS